MCSCEFYPFPTDLENKDRAKHVFEQDRTGYCQQYTLSKFSPKAIANDEYVVRAVIFPHMSSPKSNYNQEFDEGVVSDTFTMGASVQRLSSDVSNQLSSFHDIQETRAQKHRDQHPGQTPPRTYIGALKISVLQVRAIDYIANGFESADVRFYDTADEGDELHGDIFSNPCYDKAKTKLLKVMLYTAICNNEVYRSPYLASEMELIGFNFI